MQRGEGEGAEEGEEGSLESEGVVAHEGVGYTLLRSSASILPSVTDLRMHLVRSPLHLDPMDPLPATGVTLSMTWSQPGTNEVRSAFVSSFNTVPASVIRCWAFARIIDVHATS